MTMKTSLALAALLAGLCSSTASLAADLAPMPAEPPPPAVLGSEWRFQATLYGWATALNGDIGIGRLPTTDVDLSFWDILQNLDGGIMGSFYASNGQFSLLTDLVYAKISDDVTGPFGGEIGFEQKQVIASAVAGYRLPIGPPNLDISATAGVRYQHLEAEIDIQPVFFPGVSRTGSVGWADPIVGLSMHYDITDKWFLNALVDVGGFGVGSDLTAQGFAAVGYRWTKTISSAIGYRALYTDYDKDGFRYDTTMHGLYTSIGVSF